MRGGLWSSFSVPGAGICTSFEEYSDAGHDVNPDVGVAVTPLQVMPASNCFVGSEAAQVDTLDVAGQGDRGCQPQRLLGSVTP